MPYKSIEKERAYQREYREKNKEKIKRQHNEYYQKNIEELRRANIVYSATHKEVRAAWRATHKEEIAVYYKENIDTIKSKHKEYYQKNSGDVILRTKRNYEKNIVKYQQYHKNSYAKIRLETLAKVDPALKCAMCGCDDTRFLEVNHINGGGIKEHNKRGDGNHNMILLIYSGKRGIENLNLLCRACNSLDHLERVHGKTGLRVMWEKQLG